MFGVKQDTPNGNNGTVNLGGILKKKMFSEKKKKVMKTLSCYSMTLITYTQLLSFQLNCYSIFFFNVIRSSNYPIMYQCHLVYTHELGLIT